MKKTIIVVFLLLNFSIVCLSKSDLPKSKSIDAPLASYEMDDSWEMQKLSLFQLAIALRDSPEITGYFHYGSSEKHSLKKVKAHISRAIKYLSQEIQPKFRIKKSRFRLIYSGKSSDSASIYLWAY